MQSVYASLDLSVWGVVNGVNFKSRKKINVKVVLKKYKVFSLVYIAYEKTNLNSRHVA